ncbi:SDR family oxidoreductase [Kribbella qitaiheensis]|uniref:SDR family oxidoreductase n=1 Tax=Kribbella qitaiheensis TaxID=1544730 RepID=A0A7G6X5M2_9ACTN|nr:SDR family oxidoreductase [Kribbella qitaiheensis]QNE21537.1 SDR family oxidoreductase [Kribbella qitaiheensis]
MPQLSNRGSAAIVTGASRGIGRAIAERLGSNGASIVVNYHSNVAAAEAVVSAIENSGGKATAVRADVAVPDDVRRLFDIAGDLYGPPDLVVHSAGITRFAPLAEATDDDYDHVFDTNTRSTFATLREAANRVPDNGRIVVISSGAAVSPRPGAGIYAASKAACDQMVRVLAKELGQRGVTVNSVLPGPTRTESIAATLPAEMAAAIAAQTPLGRLAEPADIADIVAFLASDDSRWITGQAIHAGGGMF